MDSSPRRFGRWRGLDLHLAPPPAAPIMDKKWRQVLGDWHGIANAECGRKTAFARMGWVEFTSPCVPSHRFFPITHHLSAGARDDRPICTGPFGRGLVGINRISECLAERVVPIRRTGMGTERAGSAGARPARVTVVTSIAANRACLPVLSPVGDSDGRYLMIGCAWFFRVK